ncbi:MAG TPA: cytochrome c [Steroidobacteraceae bacterium]
MTAQQARGQQPTTQQPATQPPITQHQPPTPLPEGVGKALVERTCAQCHSLETVTGARLTRKQWEGRIDQMVAKGAKLSDDDIDVVAAYLATNFGPG